MPTFAIWTLGCRVNAFESACIRDKALAAGFDVVEWEGGADIGVVNSCALTKLAEAKTRQSIRIFARKNPHCKIAVTGCYAQTDPEGVRLENVKWIISNKNKANVVDIILDGLSAESGSELHCGGNSPLDDRMNLKIQDGCDNACAYCIIPRARGLPRSVDFEKIVADAENLVSRGVRELVLTGINIAKFSSPKGGLVALADRLNEIDGLYRLRLGSIEPPLVDVDAIAERAKDTSHVLMPSLHISAQSLSDTVLERMRRRYKARDFLEMVGRFVNLCPDIAIGGDFICGHPAETRAEFEQTRNLLENSPMAYAHVFTFSPRPKTLAWNMKDTPPAAERKARADELREVAARLRLKFARAQLGKRKTLLLENRLPDGLFFAHTDNYIPSVADVCGGEKNALAAATADSIDAEGRLVFRNAEILRRAR